MRYIYFLYFCLIFNFLFAASVVQDPVNENGSLPRNFRDLGDKNIGLNILAGGQFSGKELASLVEYAKDKYPSKQLLIVDLREETHGFVNDTPFGLLEEMNSINKNLNNKAVFFKQKKDILMLNRQKEIKVDILDKSDKLVASKTLSNFSLALEKDYVSNLYKDVKYIQIPITDHMAPKEEDIKAIQNLLNKLDKNTLIYVHCKAGKGRTTTFLSIYDIIKNGHNTSLDAILQRQYEFGGANLSELSSDYVRKNIDEERLEVLKNFYNKLHKS